MFLSALLLLLLLFWNFVSENSETSDNYWNFLQLRQHIFFGATYYDNTLCENLDEKTIQQHRQNNLHIVKTINYLETLWTIETLFCKFHRTLQNNSKCCTFRIRIGAKMCKSCRSRKILHNEFGCKHWLRFSRERAPTSLLYYYGSRAMTWNRFLSLVRSWLTGQNKKTADTQMYKPWARDGPRSRTSCTCPQTKMLTVQPNHWSSKKNELTR